MRGIRSLEDSLLAILVAVCTNEMRRNAAISGRLSSVSKRVTGYRGQLIVFFLSVPFFKTSQLFFQCSYTLQERRLRLLGFEDSFLKLHTRIVKSNSIIDVLKSLREIEGRFKRANSH
jgi:hypothetical protein